MIKEEHMGFFSWIIFGAIAGWIANKLAGKRRSIGLFKNMMLGIIGSSIGGFIARFFGGYGVTGFNLRSLVVAIIGAVVLLAIINRSEHR